MVAAKQLLVNPMEDLKRQAQEKLGQARQLLDEAARLAEEGGFSISFSKGGTYVPSAAFDRERMRKEVIEQLATELEGLSDDDRNAMIEDYTTDWLAEERPYGADEPGWWKPSRNC